MSSTAPNPQSESGKAPISSNASTTTTVAIAVGTSIVPPSSIPQGKQPFLESENPESTNNGFTDNPLSQPLPSSSETQVEKEEDAARATYSSEKAYPKAQTRSIVTAAELATIREQFLIPDQYDMRLPDPEEKIYWKPNGKWVTIPTFAFRYGVRFPLPDFISSFLSFAGIGFSQLVPNSYIHLICFIAFYNQNKIDPAIDLLSRFFTLDRSKEAGFRQLNKRPGRQVWMETPSSNKGWHPHWFFMMGGKLNFLPRWGEPNTKIMEFVKVANDRMKIFNNLYKNMPKDFWPIEHLSSHKWLFDNGLTIFKPISTPIWKKKLT